LRDSTRAQPVRGVMDKAYLGEAREQRKQDLNWSCIFAMNIAWVDAGIWCYDTVDST
jgi:hypothetical protein